MQTVNLVNASHSLKTQCVAVPVLLSSDNGFGLLPQSLQLMHEMDLLRKDLLKNGNLKLLFTTCLLPFSFKPFRDSCYIFLISLKPRTLEIFILEFKPRFPTSVSQEQKI